MYKATKRTEDKMLDRAKEILDTETELTNHTKFVKKLPSQKKSTKGISLNLNNRRLFQFLSYLPLHVFLGVLAYSLFFINNQHYWDASIYGPILDQSNWLHFIRPWEANGRFLTGVIFWYLSEIGQGVYPFRFTMLCFEIFTSFVFFVISNQILQIDRNSSFLLSLLSLFSISSICHLSFTVDILTYSALLFFVGVIFYCQYIDTNLIAPRFVAIMLFGLSLVGEYTIVPLFILPIVLIFLKQRQFSDLKQYSDLPVLAGIYFITMWFYMPVAEGYSDSRNLNLNFDSLYYFYKTYVNALYLPFLDSNLNKHWCGDIVPISILVGFVGTIYCYFFNKKTISTIYNRDYISLAIGFYILFAATILPFALAERSVETNDWSLRHALAMKVPAYLLLGVLVFGINIKALMKKIAVGFLVASFFCHFIFLQINWMGRMVYDEKIVRELKLHETNLRKVELIFANKLFLNGDFEYRDYEVTRLFQKGLQRGNLWVKSINISAKDVTSKINDYLNFANTWAYEQHSMIKPISNNSCFGLVNIKSSSDKFQIGLNELLRRLQVIENEVEREESNILKISLIGECGS